MGKLDNQVAVVTGAGSGMGAATARLFAQEGAKVLLVGRHDYNIAAVRDEITAAGGTADIHVADVGKREEALGIGPAAVDAFGRVDVLVAAAGIYIGNEGVAEESDEDWDAILSVNLSGVARSMKGVIPLMRDQGHGVIVNIASVASLVGGSGGTSYTVAKHGVLGLTRDTAMKYGKEGIRINCICPGCTISGMVPRSMIEDGSHPWTENLRRLPCDGRAVESEDIARAALFLASDDSRFCYGVALPVDGGFVIGPTFPQTTFGNHL